MKKKVLILGQGLAGTCLGLRLAMEGRPFSILASGQYDSASQKAAGLMNPVTGRRMALTWNYEEIWPLALRFYPETLAFLGLSERHFFSGRTIRKALHSTEEMNFLEAKSAWAGFHDIIRIEGTSAAEAEIFQNLRGWALSDKGARLDVPEFLNAARSYFVKEGHYLHVDFRKEDLIKSGKSWRFNEEHFDFVVSCLGLGCPWISPELWAVKGQLFILEGFPEWGQDILKTEHFLIPLPDAHVLAGSTYEREFEHVETDSDGYNIITGEILPEHLKNIRIISSRAGIRPTTHDRRPVIREIEKGLFAINGLGSKGVCLAPYAADLITRMIFPEESAH
jgi:glycine/D-amino acid oxidase-like deaminating enzyme